MLRLLANFVNLNFYQNRTKSIMPLVNQVKQICDRLALAGWRNLFLQHGLDITAGDLKTELTNPLLSLL